MRKIALVYLFVIIGAYLSMCGCTTQKKATNYFMTHKDQLASICSEEFPPVQTFVNGKDSIAYDTTYSIIPVYDKLDTTIVIGNSKNSYITKTVRRVDTLKVIDNSKVFKLTTDNATLQSSLNKSQSDLVAETKRAENRLFWIIGLGITVLALIAAICCLFYFKIF